MFSKETCLLDTPSEKLREELAEELKLSAHNIQSNGWYHGRIPWKISESLVVQNGDFLVRDSLTSFGDYVLTCRWNQKPLHFLISKVVLRGSEIHNQTHYILEGDAFDSVPVLVHFYVSSQIPITQQSGALVQSPVNRTLPLHYLETMFGQSVQEGTPLNSPVHKKGSIEKRESIAVTETLSIDVIQPQREAVRSFAGTLEQRLVVKTSPTPQNTVSRRPSPSRNRKFVVIPSSPVMERPIQMHLCTSPIDDHVIYLEPTDNIWDTITGSCQNITADLSSLQYNASLYSSSFNYTEASLSRKEDHTVLSFMGEDNEDYLMPLVIETASSFKPTVYQSPLLPAENKPLERRLLRKVKEVLVDADPKTIAMHITKADCMAMRILNHTNDRTKMMTSGIELLTLPHGHHLRQDLLERSHTMSIMLAVMFLGCTGSVEERSILLHKLISLASELQTNVQNMFGFAAVMRALELPQVARLEDSWKALRQKFTESAILYEKTLKPLLSRMNDGTEPCDPSETIVPHMLPLMVLLERTAAVVEGDECWESLDTGMDSLRFHLDAARKIACSCGIFSCNAKAKFEGFRVQLDLLEVFLTEFQMRLLWGSKGVKEGREQRFEKFDKVLTALSNRLETSWQAN